ncbi:MAG: ribosome silencing factor [Saprospiraceae bacterium]
MSSQPAVSTSAKQTLALSEIIVDSIQDIKGKRIVRLDLREIEDSPADFFIVCEGESTVQVKAISGNVRQRARNERGERPGSIEGMETGMWVCMDYFDIVVHIFSPEAREFYDLESLWSDAPVQTYEDI